MDRRDFASSFSTKTFWASSSAGVRVCALTPLAAMETARTATSVANRALTSGTVIETKAVRQARALSSQWLTGADHGYIHFHIGCLAVDRFVETEFFMRIFNPHGS